MATIPGYEPGPSDPTPMPLSPRVTSPGLFVGLAGELAGIIDGVDDALGGAAGTIAPLAGINLTPQFDTDVTPAIDTIGHVGNDQDASVPGAAIAAGDAVAADIAAQRGELPHAGASEPHPWPAGPVEREPEDVPPPPPPPPEP